MARKVDLISKGVGWVSRLRRNPALGAVLGAGLRLAPNPAYLLISGLFSRLVILSAAKDLGGGGASPAPRSFAALRMTTGPWRMAVGLLVLGVSWLAFAASAPPLGAPLAGPPATPDLTTVQAEAGSVGCLTCHAGIEPIHASAAVRLTCVDCHGGDGEARTKDAAHPKPRFPEAWAGADGKLSAANPVRSYTLLNRESPEWIRFVNPGDLRVAQQTCGACHQKQVNAVAKSPMTTTAVFWAAAGYANGILSTKRAILGESYAATGAGQAVRPLRPPTPEELGRGALAALLPLPRWQTTQPGEYFRAFERGGIFQPSAFPEIANPAALDEAGKPDIRLSNRGLGTGLRISPALINLHKTRLNDPHLSFLGTNDHAGDFRSSGCSGCHLVYANDREPRHSGPWAAAGHGGTTQSRDPTLAKSEPGHPIRHQLTRAVPTAQCMSCHMHQPNSFVNTYLGYTIWDYETDGELLWPREQSYPGAAEARSRLDANPEGAAVRGLWGDPAFLARVSELNDRTQHTRFADYHGHGWVFRAVLSRDRKGNLLDRDGRIVPFEDSQRLDKAVHLADVHLERGMHCADCHFSQDVHGEGLLHGEYGNTIEIECQDCHGGVGGYTKLRTSGPAAPPGGTDLLGGTTPFGARRFSWRHDDAGRVQLVQRSMLEPEREWVVPQVKDSMTPGHPRYNPRSAWAKTVRRDGDGLAWGAIEKAATAAPAYAHQESQMTCYSCHSSWITSCFGCHLPQEANVKSAVLRYEGGESRNYASYNPQVVRADVFMLGRNSPVKGAKVAPVRSSSALVLSSTNLNRQRFYLQQPPISTPGYSSQAFNPHVPHTVRTRETKACSDCHLSEAGDNNAWLAQLLLQGTGFVNFIGRFAWVGEGRDGFEAVAVTEWDEPQAVLGSYLHRLAYPDFFRRHQEWDLELAVAHHHDGGRGKVEVRSLQLRGEYLFTAKGAGGFEVFDAANVDNKDFSERIVTAPVSPLGQRTFVRTRFATAVALPTNQPVAPQRDPNPDPANGERPMHPLYRYALLSDREEGLILVDVTTLTDRDPTNNFLERAVTFNPQGVLRGAENLTVAGHWAYLVGAFGLAVVDLDDPVSPRLVATVPDLRGPKAVAVQFRYAFVAGEDGLTVLDVTHPERPRVAVRLPEAGPVSSVYLARTYAYLAAGKKGVVIVDVEKPEAPFVDQVFDAGGALSDTRDVKVGATNASLFAYVADGENGLAVLQLTSPETVPGYLGFSPRPSPRLIARRHTHGPALALSRGLERDRAVDESGHQVAVFNRIGARPFTLEEMQRLYLYDGKPFTVPNVPPSRAAEEAP